MGRRHDLERARELVRQGDVAVSELKERLEAVRKRIEEMYEPHTHPVPWDGLRLGNSLPRRWYCDACRKQWPCADFNALRELHSITFGGDGEPATPVTLAFVPTDRVKL